MTILNNTQSKPYLVRGFYSSSAKQFLSHVLAKVASDWIRLASDSAHHVVWVSHSKMKIVTYCAGQLALLTPAQYPDFQFECMRILIEFSRSRRLK